MEPIGQNPSVQILNRTKCSDAPLSVGMLYPLLCNTTKQVENTQECIEIQPCPVNTTSLLAHLNECQYSCTIQTRRIYTLATTTTCFWWEIYKPGRQTFDMDAVWLDDAPTVTPGYYTIKNLYEDRESVRLKAVFDPLIVTLPLWWIGMSIGLFVAFWIQRF